MGTARLASAENSIALAANGLACRRGDRVLFANLSLDLEEGQALQVMGPNGSGKTSLMRLLAGLARPYSGAVRRHGAVALLDERPALAGQWPLDRALAFWADCDGADRLLRDAALETTGLSSLGDVPVCYLSTGQRKRAAMARLMAQRAPIWLLDEPLSGLDTPSIAVIERLVAEHCATGGICVIASHQPLRLVGLSTLALTDFAP